MSTPPLVSVVTPFHNTADYLEECIRSVLAQTWQQFEYVLVNNCSTDGSAEIARRWASRDTRLRVIDQPAFLEQVENYNAAVKYIDAESEYVKIVQADDWLLPECLARMVAVAESDATIVLVGSYHLYGDLVLFSGVPIDRSVHDGRDIARAQLRSHHYLLGNPSTLLYRAASVRSRAPLFPLNRIHEDTELALNLLGEGRFGFVPQVLSYVRTDNESRSDSWRDHDWFLAMRYTMVRRFGRRFFSAHEFQRLEEDITREYWWRLVRRIMGGRGGRYRAFHRARLAEGGEPLVRSLVYRWPARFCTSYLRRAARAAVRKVRAQ